MTGTHPQRTGDPATLRWAATGIGVAPAGPAVVAPLAELVEAGTLAGFEIERDAVATTLAGGFQWAEAGRTVRTAVIDTMARVAQTLAELDPAGREAVLTRAAEQAVAELVAPIATAHGGSVALVAVVGPVVTVRLRGACAGCPAASITLHGRLEAELRRRVPWPVTVRADR